MTNFIAVLGGQADAAFVVDELLTRNYAVAWIWQADLPQSAAIGKCQIYPNSRLSQLSGHVGSYRLQLIQEKQRIELEAAVIIVATGNERAAITEDKHIPSHTRVISTQQLAERLAAPRRIANITPAQHQHIIFALDLTALSGREATNETLQLAWQARRQWHCEVSVLYRELQVDSDQLEQLTRHMRELGIVFHRLQAQMPTADDAGVHVAHADGTLSGDLLVIPPTVHPRKDNTQLAALLQIMLGEDGYFQQLNVRSYRPGLSNRKGIFLAGRCHMDTDDAGARADAVMAASNVEALLNQQPLLAESVIAQVDSAKCIRCLTCIRTCPHAAVELAQYEQTIAARVIDLACFGCGMCAANCPVRAITMRGADVPAWLQEAALI